MKAEIQVLKPQEVLEQVGLTFNQAAAALTRKALQAFNAQIVAEAETVGRIFFLIHFNTGTIYPSVLREAAKRLETKLAEAGYYQPRVLPSTMFDEDVLAVELPRGLRS